MPVFDQSPRSAARSRIRAAIRVCPMGSQLLMAQMTSTSGLAGATGIDCKARSTGIGFSHRRKNDGRASAGMRRRRSP